MDLINQVIELRILLNNYCDGFMNNGKNTTLSTKFKILFLLNNSDCSPNDLIDALCIAKSNIANILKTMIENHLVESYKVSDNSKNIYYRITSKGETELKAYKDKVKEQIAKKCDKADELSNELTTIINILKGKQND